jgi:putative ABC transport system permease protein
VTGGAVGSSLALALLVCGCVFLALAGPAVSLKLRTQAMQQQISKQGDLTADADWYQFASDDSVSPPLDSSAFSAAAASISQSLGGTVPLAPGAWAGLTTTQYSAPPDFVGLQIPALFEVTYRNKLTSSTQIVAGRLGGSAIPAGYLGVSVTVPTAARFDLHPGSTITLTGSGAEPAVRVYVTGIVRVLHPASSFWTTDVLAAGPVYQPAAKSTPGAPPGNWQGALLTDPGQLLNMQTLFCPDPGQVRCSSMELNWELPFAIGDFNADQAQKLVNDLSAATTDSTLASTLGQAAGDLTIEAPALTPLNIFISDQTAVLSILVLLFASLIAIGLVVIALAAWLMTVRREEELAMLRARGATTGQLARRMVPGTALAALPAAVAGALLAALVILLTGTVHGAGLGAGWRLACAVPILALCGPPLIAAWRYRRPQPTAVNQAIILTAETRASRFSPAAIRRIVAGGTLCLACAAGLLLLHDQGLPAPGSVNWLFTIAPVLVAIPAALVAMRLYPLAIRLLLRCWHRVPATGFVALSSATRIPASLSAYTVVLTLTLAAFCGMVSGSVSKGQVATSWQTVGADATISVNGPITPSVMRQIKAVPGVRHSTAVAVTDWLLPNQTQITLIGVDPAQYAALTADTPFPGLPAGTLRGRGPVYPVLVSSSEVAQFSRGVNKLTGQTGISGSIKVRVAGTIRTTPAQPGGSQFAIIGAQTLPVPGAEQGPDLILITGNVDRAALSTLVSDELPGSSLAFRSTALSALASAPLIHVAALLMTLTVIACSGLAVLSVLLGLALGVRERMLTMARLTVMGHQHNTRFMLLTALPSLLAAAAGAVACALALPSLIGPTLNLSTFISNGSTGPVTVRFVPDLLAICLPSAAIALLAVLALTAQTHRSRHDVTGLLRVSQ